MARLFRTSPLNAIWEGSGNVIALDIQRALGDERIAAAFTTEIARIGDEISSVKPLTDWIAQAKDADPRLFAERAAIVFSADALPAGPVRDAYITLRLMAPSHLWGANAGQIDCDLLVDRAVGWV